MEGYSRGTSVEKGVEGGREVGTEAEGIPEVTHLSGGEKIKKLKGQRTRGESVCSVSEWRNLWF